MHIASAVGKLTAPDRTFVSKHGGYSVRYPATWNLLRSSIDNTTDQENLDILSFPSSKRAEAVTIIHGGAQIILRKRAALSPSKEDEVLSSKTFALKGPCRSANVVESRWEVGPKTFERDISYACKTPSAHYELSIRMWDDDQRREQYKAVGLQILESLQEK